MNFTQYNKNTFEKIEWNVNTKDFVFKKIGDLFEDGVTKVQVFGFFFIKSKDYGLQPIAILKDCLLNLPTHKRDIISEMLKDKETVESIKKGECGLTFSHYKSKYNKFCYDVDFYNYVDFGNNVAESKDTIVFRNAESTDNVEKPIF